MSDRYMTTHNNWDPNFMLPLPVATVNDQEVFVDPMWGIRIERVMSDGSIVPSQGYDIDLDDVNFKKIRVEGVAFVYLVRLNSFHFARSFNEDDFQLEKYAIDQSANHIHIMYRLRTSNVSLGPLTALDSYRV